jgi:hypothetical protein
MSDSTCPSMEFCFAPLIVPDSQSARVHISLFIFLSLSADTYNSHNSRIKLLCFSWPYLNRHLPYIYSYNEIVTPLVCVELPIDNRVLF